MSMEGISQPERRTASRSNDSSVPAEEVAQRLKLVGDLTRLQLATTLTKASEELARRDS